MRVVLTRDLDDIPWLQFLLDENLPVDERDEQIVESLRDDPPLLFDGAEWRVED